MSYTLGFFSVNSNLKFASIKASKLPNTHAWIKYVTSKQQINLKTTKQKCILYSKKCKDILVQQRLHHLQRGKNNSTYNTNKGIFIVASRARKWDHATFKIARLSLIWVSCWVFGKIPSDAGSSKIFSTSWLDGCVRNMVSHLLKSLWIADDVSMLSFVSDA